MVRTALREKKTNQHYDDKSLLILDGFGPHKKAVEERAEIIDELNLTVLFMPPHTSGQLHPCDLHIFNEQKMIIQKFLKIRECTSLTNQILATYKRLYRASDQQDIIIAFNCAGIYKKRIYVNEGIVKTYYTAHTYQPETNSFLKVLIKSILNIIDSSTEARNEITMHVSQKKSAREIVYP